MDPVVMAAGTALVGAMATEAWQQARTGVVALWRRGRPEQAETVEAELAEVRADVLAARDSGDDATEQALAGSWQVRLQQLIRANPDLAAELQRVLHETLTPVLALEEKDRIASITLKASARDRGRVYQAGRDQHFNE